MSIRKPGVTVAREERNLRRLLDEQIGSVVEARVSEGSTGSPKIDLTVDAGHRARVYICSI